MKNKSDLVGTVWERKGTRYSPEPLVIIKIVDTTKGGQFKIICWFKRENYDEGRPQDSFYFDCIAAFYQRTRKKIKGATYTFLHRAQIILNS